MKSRLVCFLALIALAAAATPSDWRRCIYINGECQECEEGTFAYTPEAELGGCGYKIPEATCDQPLPLKEKSPICDYSACYCEYGTYRNAEGKCVQFEDCPTKD